jgi:hypothetical protein
MNKDCLIDQLAGQWIIQSANYSLLKRLESRDLLLNQVQWLQMPNYAQHLEQIKQYYDNNKSVSICRIRSKNNNGTHTIIHILLLHQGPQLSSIVKLDENFAFLNQSIVQSQSEDQLTIMSSKGNISIVEKIYFLNCNFKVVKSTIQRCNKCIGTSFSSEIRIS